MLDYIGAAVTIVAGMAWNDAVKSTMDTYIHKNSDSIAGKYLYALIVSVISVTIIYLMTSFKTQAITVLPTRATDMLNLNGKPQKTLNDISKSFIMTPSRNNFAVTRAGVAGSQ